jgi:hypothetical protein
MAHAISLPLIPLALSAVAATFKNKNNAVELVSMRFVLLMYWSLLTAGALVLFDFDKDLPNLDLKLALAFFMAIDLVFGFLCTIAWLSADWHNC